MAFKQKYYWGYALDSTNHKMQYNEHMEDYPKTLAELENRFATDEACRDYLFKLRWQDVFACPKCGGNKMWSMKNGLILCGSCRNQVSVMQGTIFQGRDRKSVVQGKSVDLGGRRIIKKKNKYKK